jgi:hypothetical protein
MADSTLIVETSVIPPGYFYLAGPGGHVAMLFVPPPRRWWRRTVACLGRRTMEGLTRAGSVWVHPYD